MSFQGSLASKKEKKWKNSRKVLKNKKSKTADEGTPAVLRGV